MSVEVLVRWRLALMCMCRPVDHDRHNGNLAVGDAALGDHHLGNTQEGRRDVST